MAVNQKAVKVLNKVLEAGFTDEKAIAAMTMDDILSKSLCFGSFCGVCSAGFGS